MQTNLLKNINLQTIIDALANGKTIVYPTETCYGLGCDATNNEAVKKIFQIKQRVENKPCLLLFPSIEMAKEYTQWNDTFEALAQKYWPGPLTMVAPLKEGKNLSPLLQGPGNTIAFRVSNHPFIQQFFKVFHKPLVSTSANIAGGPNPYTMQTVQTTFENQNFQPDMLLDAGTLAEHPPSTLVTLDNGNIKVLRQGEITIEH